MGSNRNIREKLGASETEFAVECLYLHVLGDFWSGLKILSSDTMGCRAGRFRREAMPRPERRSSLQQTPRQRVPIRQCNAAF